MELKTFDTILTELCDNFDNLISPKSISRTNTNIIYLLFKAIAKGFEVINNTCVVLSNKFNPSSCTVEDLDSIASLVGTKRLNGSATGLHIMITNNNNSTVTLLQGVYQYVFDEDTTFVFEILENTDILSEMYITVIAMSENIGSFPVTKQNNITVTSTQQIPENVSFSCSDNSSLLGVPAETDIEFRKRILEGYNNQNNIIELQNEIRSLPYIFDCRIKFNNSIDSITYNNIDIPPFTCAIFYSGAIRSEIAEVIASKLMCPTVQTTNSVAVSYNNPVFSSGNYTFYLIPFAKTDFSVEITYKLDSLYANDYDVRQKIQKALNLAFISEIHKDYVKENDIYNILEGLDLIGVDILDVNLKQNDTPVSYVEVPLSNIPNLTNITFNKE